MCNLWWCAVTDMFILYSNAHTHKRRLIKIFLLCLHINTVSVVSFPATGEISLILLGKRCLLFCFSFPIWSSFLNTTAWTLEECFLLYSHHWTQDEVIEYIPWIFIQLHKLKVTNNYKKTQVLTSSYLALMV